MAKVEVESENPQPFSGWKFHKKKEGGANEAGILGGVYKNPDTGQMAMIKQEKDPANNISEFLGSQIFATISPEGGARVFLTVASDLEAKLSQEHGLQDDGSNVYVRSEYLKNYSDDLYKDMDKNLSEQDKPSSWLRKDGARPLFIGTRNMLFGTLEKAFKKLKYQGFEKVAPPSLLLNDFDMHVGNIGVLRENKPEELPELVRIDFAGSLLKLSNKIKPHSFLRHLPLRGPTNHYREFPSSLKNNHKFANSILAAAKVDINATIDESFKEMSKYYSDEALLGWAKKSMPAKFNYTHIKTLDVDIIKDAFKEVMQNRQESLQEYGLQIKLGLLIQEKDKKFQVNKPALKKLIEEHPKYFKKIILQPDILKLRKKVSFIDNLRYKKSILGILVKEIKNTYGIVIKEKKAKDKIKSTLHSPLEKNKIKDTSRETYKKQQQHSNMKPSTGETVMPIKWEQNPVIVGNKIVRSTIIKDLNLTLKETTVKTPIRANNVYVSSYRKIDLPLVLEASQNDIDLSFAVKQVNGKNINVKDAKYFTAHYKQGKLMSMTYPKPLKFASKDKDTIGYITGENGKIYTVPVTQNIFNKMTKQIEKNQELAQTLDQKSKIIGDKLKKTLIIRSKEMASNKLKKPLLKHTLLEQRVENQKER